MTVLQNRRLHFCIGSHHTIFILCVSDFIANTRFRTDKVHITSAIIYYVVYDGIITEIEFRGQQEHINTIILYYTTDGRLRWIRSERRYSQSPTHTYTYIIHALRIMYHYTYLHRYVRHAIYYYNLAPDSSR